MSLPTVANLCSVNHRAIAYLGDDCPICTGRTPKGDMPPAVRDGHIWPHTYQLLQVLRRQYAPKVSDAELRALLP